MIKLDRKFVGDALLNQAEERYGDAVAAVEAIRERTCVGAEWTGWFDYPRTRGQAAWEEAVELPQRLDVHYDLVVVVGIGGSYLGTRAIADSQTHRYWQRLPAGKAARPPIVYAGCHVSEVELIELLDLLDGFQPVVNVVSKSGTTTEPAVAFRVLHDYLVERFGSAEADRRIVVTTDGERGALRTLAQQRGYPAFVVPEDIGGRFSVLTPVGLVPLALAGFDGAQLLWGAEQVFAALRDSVSAASPCLQYAVTRVAAYEAGKRVDLLAFSEPRLAALAEWWKQLFGESEGKQGKGMLPASAQYTTDLHSLGQYVQEGTRTLLETFLRIERPFAADLGPSKRVLEVPGTAQNLDGLGYLEGRRLSDINDAAMDGTRIAHAAGGVPAMELRLRDGSLESLGALLAFFQVACGVSAAMIGVNPYDQPGVEAYKTNLFGLLGKPGFEAKGAELRSMM